VAEAFPLTDPHVAVHENVGWGESGFPVLGSLSTAVKPTDWPVWTIEADALTVKEGIPIMTEPSPCSTPETAWMLAVPATIPAVNSPVFEFIDPKPLDDQTMGAGSGIGLFALSTATALNWAVPPSAIGRTSLTFRRDPRGSGTSIDLYAPTDTFPWVAEPENAKVPEEVIVNGPPQVLPLPALVQDEPSGKLIVTIIGFPLEVVAEIVAVTVSWIL
jgi:hypothetical protein